MTFQAGSFTTSASISPEGICNDKRNCVAGFILCTLWKSILGEHGNCRISTPTVKKVPPHPLLSPWDKMDLKINPPPRHIPWSQFQTANFQVDFSTRFKPGAALLPYTILHQK